MVISVYYCTSQTVVGGPLRPPLLLNCCSVSVVSSAHLHVVLLQTLYRCINWVYSVSFYCLHTVTGSSSLDISCCVSIWFGSSVSVFCLSCIHLAQYGAVLGGGWTATLAQFTGAKVWPLVIQHWSIYSILFNILSLSAMFLVSTNSW